MSSQEGATATRSLLTMTWRDALFAHWAVPESLVAQRLPDRLSIDTHEGQAYLGVVPFVMDDISPRGIPVGLSFGEVNLRTYVQGPDGTRGVYFFNLDADDRLGVFFARRLFELPYFRAEMTVERRGRQVTFRSRRPDGSAAFVATYGPAGDQFTADPGSLPHFLTERYRFYTATSTTATSPTSRGRSRRRRLSSAQTTCSTSTASTDPMATRISSIRRGSR